MQLTVQQSCEMTPYLQFRHLNLMFEHQALNIIYGSFSVISDGLH